MRQSQARLDPASNPPIETPNDHDVSWLRFSSLFYLFSTPHQLLLLMTKQHFPRESNVCLYLQSMLVQVEISETAEAAARVANGLAELGHLLPCQGLFGKAPQTAAQDRAAVRQAGQQAEVWMSPSPPVTAKVSRKPNSEIESGMECVQACIERLPWCLCNDSVSGLASDIPLR